MIRSDTIPVVRLLLISMLCVSAATVRAQSPATRPPGAPSGTTSADATVVPTGAPVGTPAQAVPPLVRGSGARQLPGSGLQHSQTPPSGPSAAAPWTVTLVPRNLPFRVGQCSPVTVELLDASGKETPRGPDGMRVSLADFDMSVSSGSTGVIGQYYGASSWSACVCPAVQPGTSVTVTATYPARSIAAKSVVPGVAFRSYMTLTVGPAPAGSGNPGICATIPATTTVATGGQQSGSGNGVGVQATPSNGSAYPQTVTVAGAAQPAPAAATATGVAIQSSGYPPAPQSGAGIPGTTSGTTGTVSPGNVSSTIGSPAATVGQMYAPPATVAVVGTPAEAHVTWGAARGANAYSVTRWKESDPACCRANSPALAGSSTSWTDLVQSTGPWMYRVTAIFPDGSQQSADARYLYPEPQAPTGFRATQTAPGVVTLSWQPVPNASYYVVGGPPGNTAIRVDGTSTVRTNVPPGNQSWILATNYESSAGPQQGSAFINATLLVSAAGVSPPAAGITPGITPSPAPSGRYRVIATGFRVLHETQDDILSRDGKADEVYGAFTMFHFDRTSSAMLDRDLRRTKVIGDINQHPGRLKGGTASMSGGFGPGDVFPAVADPSMRYQTEPTDQSFPFLVWQGTLTDAKDAVIILPTLWEWDGNDDGYNKWFESELAHASNIWSDVGVQSALTHGDLGLITPPGQVETSYGKTFTATAVFEFLFIGAGPFSMLGTGDYDRPIGATMGAGGSPSLPRRAIVITRENVEVALQKRAATVPGSTLPSGVVINLPPNATAILPNGGLPFGTIAVPLFDGPGDLLQGRYILYLTVERIP